MRRRSFRRRRSVGRVRRSYGRRPVARRRRRSMTTRVQRIGYRM